jgi:hypothetical protein
MIAASGVGNALAYVSDPSEGVRAARRIFKVISFSHKMIVVNHFIYSDT